MSGRAVGRRGGTVARATRALCAAVVSLAVGSVACGAGSPCTAGTARGAEPELTRLGQGPPAGASSERLGSVAPSPDANEAAPQSADAIGTTPDDSAPRRNLGLDEARGGHTLERHVGKTDEDLRARLRRERQISAASSYTDRVTAERTVAAAFVQQSQRVRAWTARRGPRPNLAIDFEGQAERPIGRSLRRGARRAEPCIDAVVVLRWDERRGDFYVLTSYPELRR